MARLTRRERLNKRKGKMGSGWGESRKHRRLSEHIFANERWLVVPPLDGKPMAFFSEHHAMHVATAVAGETKMNVEVTQQILNDEGEWVEAPDNDNQ